MAEHDYTPPTAAAVNCATPPPSAIIIAFPPRSRRAMIDAERIGWVIREAENVATRDLVGAAAVSAQLALMSASVGNNWMPVALKAFLCLARALDDAGLPVRDMIGGAA